MWDFIQDQISNNDFFKGGLILGIFGALAVYFKTIPSYIYNLIKYYLTFEVMFDSRDSSFEYFTKWISDKNLIKNKRKIKIEINEKVEPPLLNMTLARQETYYIQYQGVWMIISRDKEEPVKKIGQDNSFSDMLNTEKYTIKCFIWNKAKLLKFINEAVNIYSSSEVTSTAIFSFSYNWWSNVGYQSRKDFDKLVFSDNIDKKIISDLDKFFSSRAWYDNMNIPYQRGYLFSGPPGTGKTSIASAIAGHYGLKLCAIDLSDITSDGIIKNAFATAPGRSVILIEDFDSYFEGRKNNRSDSKLTFSGFINAINGVRTNPGRILILTTNVIKNVDPALVRAGRIDKHFKIGYLSKDQAVKLYKLYGYNVDSRVINSAKILSENNIPPSDLVEHFIYCREDESKIFDMDFLISERNIRMKLDYEISEIAKKEIALKSEEKEEKATGTPEAVSAPTVLSCK